MVIVTFVRLITGLFAFAISALIVYRRGGRSMHPCIGQAQPRQNNVTVNARDPDIWMLDNGSPQ